MILMNTLTYSAGCHIYLLNSCPSELTHCKPICHEYVTYMSVCHVYHASVMCVCVCVCNLYYFRLVSLAWDL